jgi:Protein of unknown function (DUF3761)
MPQRRYIAKEAPPKPTKPPCADCEDAYWRYNGQDWYSAGRGSTKRHFCTSDAAQQRREREAIELQEKAVQAVREMRRSSRGKVIAKSAAALIAAAIAALWLYGEATKPGRPGGGQPSGNYGQVQQPVLETPTAKCADGTLSYSANHQGACSWHGGVDTWYR